MSVDKTEFECRGYALIPNCVPVETIEVVRSHLEKATFLGEGVGLSISRTMDVPGLEEIILNDTSVSFAKEVLGPDLVLFPNLTFRKNSQVPWHVDDAFRRKVARAKIGVELGFVQMTVYFQDNSEFGGGLDVVPGSHDLERIAESKQSIQDVVRSLLEQSETIWSASGDLVCWNGQLLHRSTPWKRESERGNLAAHWTVAKASADINDFFWHLVRRGRTRGDVLGVDRRYGEMEWFVFAKDATKPFNHRATTYGIQLYDISVAEREPAESGGLWALF